MARGPVLPKRYWSKSRGRYPSRIGQDPVGKDLDLESRNSRASSPGRLRKTPAVVRTEANNVSSSHLRHGRGVRATRLGIRRQIGL